MKTRRKSTKKGEEGAALLLTLFLISFSALYVGALLRTVSADLRIVSNHRSSTNALYIAEAGIQRAIASLTTDSGWSAGFQNLEFPSGSGKCYSVTVDNTSPLVVLTSAGTADGFTRKVEAKLIVTGSASPYEIRIMHWKEL